MNEQQANLVFNQALQCIHEANPLRALALLEGLASNFPQNPNVHFLLGITKSALGNKFDAINSYDIALKIQPNFADAYVNKAADFYSIGNLEEAALNARAALAIDPSNPLAWLNLGNAQKSLEMHHDALISYDNAININNKFSEAWNNRAEVLNKLKKHTESIASSLKAIESSPNYAEAYYNLGMTYVELKNFDEALAAYKKSIELKPNNADAYNNLGIAYVETKNYASALTSFKKALELNPRTNWLQGSFVHTSMKICEWDTYHATVELLQSNVSQGFKVTLPFPTLAIFPSLSMQKLCSEIYTNSAYPPSFRTPLPIYRHKKIRLAYMSCDFKEHALTYLMTGIIKSHNREKFQVYGIDIGADDCSLSRMHITEAFDTLYQVENIPDSEIADLILKLEIDILVDLTGHTYGSRTAILASKAAPIQINYLGYPGTMGSTYIDYIIGDSTLIPTKAKQGYSEKIVYLPNCFQANNSNRIISQPKTKIDFGLNEDSFVFGSFNQCVKFTPTVFKVWLSILKQVPHSILWLIKDNDLQVENLRKFSAENGVFPDRLIFADKLPYDEHLARYALMDLALDTMPFNGGTTTSDALWGGAPVLTCIGETFAGRMAASLLFAIGLPELITQSLEEYEFLAVELATNPDKLAAIRQKLADNRQTSPLFDTQQFTKQLENAYEQMVERHQQCLPPDHIYVSTT